MIFFFVQKTFVAIVAKYHLTKVVGDVDYGKIENEIYNYDSVFMFSLTKPNLKLIKEINLKLLKEKNEVKEKKGQTEDYLYIYTAKVIPVTTLNFINSNKKKIQYNLKKNRKCYNNR